MAQPIEQILARNLIATLSLPAFLVDSDGEVVFFNESASKLIGKRFEESGRLSREQWKHIGPFDADGTPLSDEGLPLNVALRQRRPGFGRFHICTDDGVLIEVDVTALPLSDHRELHGAMVVFWRANEEGR